MNKYECFGPMDALREAMAWIVFGYMVRRLGKPVHLKELVEELRKTFRVESAYVSNYNICVLGADLYDATSRLGSRLDAGSNYQLYGCPKGWILEKETRKSQLEQAHEALVSGLTVMSENYDALYEAERTIARLVGKEPLRK